MGWQRIGSAHGPWDIAGPRDLEKRFGVAVVGLELVVANGPVGPDPIERLQLEVAGKKSGRAAPPAIRAAPEEQGEDPRFLRGLVVVGVGRGIEPALVAGEDLLMGLPDPPFQHEHRCFWPHPLQSTVQEERGSKPRADNHKVVFSCLGFKGMATIGNGEEGWRLVFHVLCWAGVCTVDGPESGKCQQRP
jgi:hypothetical protein